MTALSLDAGQEAVRTSPLTGRVMVTAAAGTGKTHALLARTRFLVERGFRPERLLFLSFSRGAKDELKKRLKASNLEGCQVFTLHRLALRVLETAMRTKTFKPGGDQYERMITVLAQDYQAHSINVRQEMEEAWRTPAAAMTERQRTMTTHARQILAEGLPLGTEPITLDQTIPTLVQRCHEVPSTLDQLRRSFDHVIVDEFQDVSAVQAELIDLIAAGKPLMTVGDRWQGIYSFQGATPDVMAGFASRADVTITLDTTYRCPAQHVIAADHLTGRTTLPVRGFRGSLDVRRGTTDAEVHDHLQAVTTALAKSGAVVVLAETNDEVRTAFASLRTVLPDVTMSARSRRGASGSYSAALTPIAACLTRGSRPHGSHPLTWLPAGHLPTWAEADLALLHAAWRSGRPAAELRSILPERALPFIELWEALEACPRPEMLPGLLRRHLPTLPLPGPDVHLCRRTRTFIELAAALATPSKPEERGAVHVMTIHAVKGAEFPQVILFDPGRRSRSRSEGTAEGARLRYVALTRSSRDLVAVLGESAHPAYHRAFDPEVLRRIQRLETVFRDGQVPGPEFAEDLQQCPPAARYLAWLGLAADTSDLTAHLMEARRPAPAAPVPAGQTVRRVPLRGGRRLPDVS